MSSNQPQPPVNGEVHVAPSRPQATAPHPMMTRLVSLVKEKPIQEFREAIKNEPPEQWTRVDAFRSNLASYAVQRTNEHEAIEIVDEMYIKANVEPWALDHAAQNALFYAASYGKPLVIEHLLGQSGYRHKFDANARDNIDGLARTPVFWAAGSRNNAPEKHAEAIRMLAKYCKPAGLQIRTNKFNESVLHYAAHAGFAAAVETLLELGVKPSQGKAKHLPSHYIRNKVPGSQVKEDSPQEIAEKERLLFEAEAHSGRHRSAASSAALGGGKGSKSKGGGGGRSKKGGGGWRGRSRAGSQALQVAPVALAPAATQSPTFADASQMANLNLSAVSPSVSGVGEHKQQPPSEGLPLPPPPGLPLVGGVGLRDGGASVSAGRAQSSASGSLTGLTVDETGEPRRVYRLSVDLLGSHYPADSQALELFERLYPQFAKWDKAAPFKDPRPVNKPPNKKKGKSAAAKSRDPWVQKWEGKAKAFCRDMCKSMNCKLLLNAAKVLEFDAMDFFTPEGEAEHNLTFTEEVHKATENRVSLTDLPYGFEHYQKKLNNGQYKWLRDMVEDFNICINNARNYGQSNGNQLWIDSAHVTREYFDQEFKVNQLQQFLDAENRIFNHPPPPPPPQPQEPQEPQQPQQQEGPSASASASASADAPAPPPPPPTEEDTKVNGVGGSDEGASNRGQKRTRDDMEGEHGGEAGEAEGEGVGVVEPDAAGDGIGDGDEADEDAEADAPDEDDNMGEDCAPSGNEKMPDDEAGPPPAKKLHVESPKSHDHPMSSGDSGDRSVMPSDHDVTMGTAE
mmetsp:Transcript_36241/g.90465  ORF Transcript_36241/g.90465 Transcript_36241/m.90465 type:complete len:794 (-) Transcript_36241:287-2668(-)